MAPSSEFWLVLRATDANNYWRFGRAQSGAYQLQEINQSAIGSALVTTHSTAQAQAGDQLSCRYQADLIECTARGLLVASTQAVATQSSAVGLASWEPGDSSNLVFDNRIVTEVPKRIDVRASLAGPSTVLAGEEGQWIAGPLGPEQTTTVAITGTAPATPASLILTIDATTLDDINPTDNTSSMATLVVVSTPLGDDVFDSFGRVGSGLGSTEHGLDGACKLPADDLTV